MSRLLHLAGPGDAGRLMPMLEAAANEAGRDPPDADHALAPLLAGDGLGAVWLLGPRAAPVGFVAVGFSWSLAAGGMVAQVDDFWIRPAVRGRGMGSEALSALLAALTEAGVRRILVRAEAGGGGIFRKLGFAPQGGLVLARPLQA